MKYRDFLEKWGMAELRIKVGFLEAKFSPADADRAAAWDLYVELLTRVSTQALAPEHGDERAALESIHALFPATREILRKHGSGCGEFAKVAIPVLNQFVRPFAAKWHHHSVRDNLGDEVTRGEFREDLSQLQVRLRAYTHALAAMAGVEDLTDLEHDQNGVG